MKKCFSHRRRQIYPTSGEGGLELSAIGDARLIRRIGEGVTCIVYLAEWRDRQVIVKLYKAGAIERHARLMDEELVEFEYSRNKAFYQAEGMQRYVAEPLAYVCTGGLSAFVQEKLEGELYYHYYTKREGRVADSLFDHVREIVRLSHAAGLYDVDLHAGNLMVVENAEGEAIPKLFDFNFIPFYLHAPNPWVAMLLKLRLVDRGWRDLRKLERFHDFRRFERKIRLFGNPESV